MIHDTRPPTVVSNRPNVNANGSSSSNLSPTTSPSVLSTSSNAVVSSSIKKKIPISRIMNDIAKLAPHLMEKSNQLHKEHVHQTMEFYSCLKNYNHMKCPHTLKCYYDTNHYEDYGIGILVLSSSKEFVIRYHKFLFSSLFYRIVFGFCLK